MSTAILYARVSPKGSRATDQISIPAQLEAQRTYCGLHTYAVEAEYSDLLMSGATEARDGFRNAVDHACRASAILVVWKLDRLARDTEAICRLYKRLAAHGADLASVTEAIDTTTAAGRFFLRMLASVGEYERELISERTSTAMRHYQANGRAMSSRPPYGKRIEAGALVSDPYEQKVLLRIRELAGLGYSATEIAHTLRDERWKPRGEGWHAKSIERIIRRG